MTWKTVLKVSETPKKTEDKKGEYPSPYNLPRRFIYTTTNEATRELTDGEKEEQKKSPTKLHMERLKRLHDRWGKNYVEGQIKEKDRQNYLGDEI